MPLSIILCVMVACAVMGTSTGNYFDAMPSTCKYDNWGLPKQTAKTFEGNYDKSIRVPCESQWSKTRKPFSEAHEMATAIYYKDSTLYDNFQAIDWIPENKNLYAPGSTWGKSSNTDYKSRKPKSFMSEECSLHNDDGSTWAITR